MKTKKITDLQNKTTKFAKMINKTIKPNTTTAVLEASTK